MEPNSQSRSLFECSSNFPRRREHNCIYLTLTNLALTVAMKGLFLVLCWLTLLLGLSHALNPACIYYQELAAKNVYYLYNPEYPFEYSGEQSCLWTIKSDYKVNISCEITLPRTPDCFLDSLEIQTNETVKHKYCGNGSLSLVSDGPDMNIELTASSFTTGGRFLCQARAVERPFEYENCECGRKNPSKIVGGTDTGVNEFPMMCALVDLQTRTPFCGCTIIAKKYVLTAAHCVINRNLTSFVILVGDHDYTNATDTNAARVYGVSQIIKHPNYNPKARINDVCIVNLRSEIEYNLEVGPVCLPFQHASDSFGGNLVQLLGWGSTEFGDGPSTTLQQVTLSVLTNLQCQQKYPGVSVDQICTYAPDKDSCSMDSGGPVLWQNPTSQNVVLVGVINYGTGCAVKGSVNLRVGAYIDWITENTPDATYCVIE